jgi:hypothetical protein
MRDARTPGAASAPTAYAALRRLQRIVPAEAPRRRLLLNGL